MKERLIRLGTDRPGLVAAALGAITLALALAALLPTVAPRAFPMLQPVKVDTDPENMLSEEEAVRVFHNDMKQLLALYDIVVLGVVNDTHPDGVFNPRSLRNIHELTEYAMTLRGEAIGQKDPYAGVIPGDVIAPSTVDNIEQGGPGEVKFEWLMARPPETEEEARAVRDKARRLPFLDGTMVSEDGRAIAIYIPITAKNLSNQVYRRLRSRIAELDGDDWYYITGLPVANDVFGVEMFKQMAISAPLAMLTIFLLMLLFFRKLILIVSPMIVAMLSVIFTMGLLVATGNTIHIMSSMIPIFIMPIAVLDSIHILSEFFEKYQETRDRRKTLLAVLDTLFAPMLYTSLTSAAGFASLALTPIPPVQVFGLFVALGVLWAWLLTILLIPAYVMLFIPERKLENFGATHKEHDADAAHPRTLSGRLMRGLGGFTYHRAKLVAALSAVVLAVALYGISRITINDNPTKWFKQSHPIRVADQVLNSHFGGTYMAYLALHPRNVDPSAMARDLGIRTDTPAAPAEPPALPGGLDAPAPDLPAGLGETAPALPAGLGGDVPAAPPAPDEALPPRNPGLEVFKQPEALRYMERLQAHLLTTGAVGKSNSLADIVKTVHRELIDGTDAQYRVPDSPEAVAQCLLQYQSSHRPDDLWHMVTQDYAVSSIWVQLVSGDNQDMSRVVEAVDEFIAANPPPFDLEHRWFGLTYINVVWQEKMVWGMAQSFLGSFLVVLLMMILLFRSGLWGLISMLPLTITIAMIYGVIGFVGKDYDMPIAVLSSLTLGLAIDFAIHFLARARAFQAQYGSWDAAYTHAFGEPARAILRNVIVIAVGFLPLLAAPLLPYVTVGFFMAAILLVSGMGTLVLLPALVRLLQPLLFPRTRACSVTCMCGTCMLSAVTAVLLAAVNVHQFLAVGITLLTWLSLAAIVVLAAGCALMSRREKCRTDAAASE